MENVETTFTSWNYFWAILDSEHPRCEMGVTVKGAAPIV